MKNDRIDLCAYSHGRAIKIDIRPMTLEDIEEVAEIDQLSFANPWPQSSYRYELTSNPMSRLWVAEVGKLSGNFRLVGMIVVWLIEDEAHIATIAVHPDFRRKGIGRSLLAYALRESICVGARYAMLEVRKSNQEAQELYLKFGFEVVNRRARYYRDNNEDALLMNLNNLDYTKFELFLYEKHQDPREGDDIVFRPI